MGGSEMFLCEMRGAEGFSRRVVLKKATGGGTLVLDRIRSAATLNHPNVVALVDMIRLDDLNAATPDAFTAALGAVFFVWGSYGLREGSARKWAKSLFAISIVYLVLLFAALAIDPWG